MDALSDWLTLESLASFTTVTILVRLAVEHTKDDLDSLTRGRFKTFYYALLLAWALLFGYSIVRGTLTGETAFLNVLNGFLVSVTTKMMERSKPKQGA